MRRITLLICLNLPLFYGAAQNPDIDLLRGINLHRPKSLDRPFILLNKATDPICVTIPAGMFILGLIRRDSARKYQAAEAVLALGLSSVVTESLKYLVDRPRPYVTYPYLEHPISESSPSFPSGETTVCFALAASLSLSYPRWYIILPSTLWAVIVGYSRMDLGLHYPSDILTGAITGAGSAWLAYEAGIWLNKPRRRHHRLAGL